jgi:hypothetical protein
MACPPCENHQSWIGRQDLSDRVITRVVDLFPDSAHLKAVGLREADDSKTRRQGLETWLNNTLARTAFQFLARAIGRIVINLKNRILQP